MFLPFHLVLAANTARIHAVALYIHNELNGVFTTMKIAQEWYPEVVEVEYTLHMLLDCSPALIMPP